ncbi:MAG: putative phospholipase [Rhizobacter sp.]|nr:putative phospholipase [Rhizobacter sp.]
MKARWTDGNRFTLLENGEAFFPRVFECIASAEREVIIETFILFEDKVGLALHAALLAAARRGVRVDITVDGYGSPDLSDDFVSSLTSAGVGFHIFDPSGRLFGMRTGVFRRMHRKIAVIDGERAFIGGINYSADHLADFGPEAKQDYSVEIEGPVVDEIHRFANSAIAPTDSRKRWFKRREPQAPSMSSASKGSAQALFVTRDNGEHRNDIERHYRVAIRLAKREVIIANAYFFPGFRLLKEMRKAARRGVKVRLVLQGEPDMPIVKIAARLLYDYLIGGGVQIFEYCRRPLHGKVALVDDQWSTVGSSNLDPLSLSLNLEANVIVRDPAFNQVLRERLEYLIDHHSARIGPETVPARTAWRATVSVVVFHFLRHFPRWVSWLPAHVPRLASVPLSAARREAAGGTSHRGTGAEAVTERRDLA